MTVPARRLIPVALSTLIAASSCRAGDHAPIVSPAPSGARATVDALALAAEQCARVAGCAHPHDAPEWRNPSLCVDHWVSHANDAEAPLPGCLSSARTCEAVRACLHPLRGGTPAAYCRAHPGDLTGCDGNAVVQCGADDPDESASVDCGSFAARCGELLQPGGLSTHACLDSLRCPVDVTRAWCAGDHRVVSCRDGEIQGFTCEGDSTCREHSDREGERVAMCESPGHVDCASPGERSCEGRLLVECEAHGHFAHRRVVDCAAMGLVCWADGKGAACTRPSPVCRGGHPSCDGDALTFCAAGARARFDCRALGMGRCEADGRGPDAACRAAGPGAR